LGSFFSLLAHRGGGGEGFHGGMAGGFHNGLRAWDFIAGTSVSVVDLTALSVDSDNFRGGVVPGNRYKLRLRILSLGLRDRVALSLLCLSLL
jgi:hypothetical protein